MTRIIRIFELIKSIRTEIFYTEKWTLFILACYIIIIPYLPIFCITKFVDWDNYLF